MRSTRKTSVIVGALFLTQTVAFIIAEQLITGVLKGPDYLTGIAADANALTAVLYLVTSVGGTILAVLLYRSNLVPRWIAVLALIGYPMLFVGCVLDLFDVTDVTKGAGLVAIAPGGLFELILPIWLLAKGFNSSAQALQGKSERQVAKTG
jgi:hypothetical protein